MIAAQARIESLLFLRHGEQQLLSLIIPFAMLIGITKFGMGDRLDPVLVVFPLCLAISAMSSGFTGQAIAVAFDRRYGALKRIGASGVPPWTIIGGKIAAVLVVASIQTILLGVTALILGWHTSPSGLLFGLIILVLGVATFTSLGLLMGGSLSSELVLGGANLAWFILLGVASFALVHSGGDVNPWFNIVPSVALADGLYSGFQGSFPAIQCLSLIIWLIFGSAAAVRFFRFTS
ncbi:MAG: ABC transporter permease [Corynebacterium sp.]|nr:ABC transporter permease [Corynebacterium sp.]